MDYETLLKEYHRQIVEIFLAAGQSPFRICKQIWKLHAEMSWKLASLPTTGVVDLGVCPGHAAPVVNGYCFDCGLPRTPNH